MSERKEIEMQEKKNIEIGRGGLFEIKQRTKFQNYAFNQPKFYWIPASSKLIKIDN